MYGFTGNDTCLVSLPALQEYAVSASMTQKQQYVSVMGGRD